MGFFPGVVGAADGGVDGCVVGVEEPAVVVAVGAVVDFFAAGGGAFSGGLGAALVGLLVEFAAALAFAAWPVWVVWVVVALGWGVVFGGGYLRNCPSLIDH